MRLSALNILIILGFTFYGVMFLLSSKVIDTSSYDGIQLITHEIKVFKYQLFMFIFIIIGYLANKDR